MKTKMTKFRKKAFCPSSETILEYVEGALSTATRQRTRSHLENCDFCGAEHYFLARHRLVDEQVMSVPIPSQVRVVLEKALLDGPGLRRAQRAA